MIKILDANIANKIAAGEVVERPLSVVKELVENSIDAKAKTIEVSLIDSGMKKITVSDDGSGMSLEDLQKAFLRHATSKIASEYDLNHISSLGFRGEALPSIASISDITIQSTYNNESHILKLVGGIEESLNAGSLINGTKITVSDLFYNTPARLKFIKNLNTELNHIHEYLQKMALGYPHIKISLINNEKQIFKSLGRDMHQAINAIYGIDVAKKMTEIKFSFQEFNISGFFADPSITRANKNYISILINGRVIKNYNLINAVVEGYKDFLFNNRYPIVILNIECDYSLVDVNVHPNKLEVRFPNEFLLKDAIIKNIYQALQKKSLVFDQDKFTENIILKNDVIVQNNDSYVKENNILKKDNYVDLKKESYVKNYPISNKTKIPIETYKNLFSTIEEKEEKYESVAMDFDDFSYSVIGQFNQTYIICEKNKSLFLIDQHAAMERFNYEKIIKKGITKDKQMLITPLLLEYNVVEINSILLLKEDLKRFNIEIELFGETTFKIDEIPLWIDLNKAKHIIELVIQKLLKNKFIEIKDIIDEVAIMQACKMSLKAHQNLNFDEMNMVISQLSTCDNKYTCPHGRPIIIEISNQMIEKMFKRIV